MTPSMSVPNACPVYRDLSPPRNIKLPASTKEMTASGNVIVIDRRSFREECMATAERAEKLAISRNVPTPARTSLALCTRRDFRASSVDSESAFEWPGWNALSYPDSEPGDVPEVRDSLGEKS